MKAQVSVASVHGLRQCMECLGGVGYCENNEEGGIMNMAKIYRDNLVNPIWEGTVSVMVEDVVRVLLGKRLGGGDILKSVFATWVQSVLSSCSSTFEPEIATLKENLQVLSDPVHGASKEELLYRGRELLTYIEVIVSGSAVLYDATVNPESIANEIAVRWVLSKALNSQVATSGCDWMDTLKTDKIIFLGTSHYDAHKTSRL